MCYFFCFYLKAKRYGIPTMKQYKRQERSLQKHTVITRKSFVIFVKVSEEKFYLRKIKLSFYISFNLGDGGF